MSFQFQYYDLGQRSAGEIVEVSLSGSAANVRLLTSSEYQNYKAGRNHRGIGGLATKSPVRLQIPNTGRWYVTVDLIGLRGTVRSSVRVVPGALRPLPPFQDAPLSSVPSLVQGRPPDESGQTEDDNDREYDVFISHASEDKDAVVRQLAEAMRDSGLKVWYDDFELKIGDSLRRKIDKGLSNSRFGVVILSQSFFKKGWTNYELDGLVTRANTGEQIILPIWHNISKAEVIKFSPSLADKVARSTSTHTLEEIAKEIVDLIRG